MQEAEAIDLILPAPVLEGVHDQAANVGMPAIQHSLGSVIDGSIQTPQGHCRR